MIPNLIIIIILPIIMTIVSVSPFEPPELEEEQIPETPVDESPASTSIIIVLLAIVWLFFIARMLKVLYAERYKSRIRK